MNRRRWGEILLALGLAAMVAAAAAVRELTGNQFVVLFGAGVGAFLNGLRLTLGGRRG